MNNETLNLKDLVFIAIGSNLGNRYQNLKRAVRLLNEHEQIHLFRASHVYLTKACQMSENDAPPFMNMVCSVLTDLTPEALLLYCQEVEQKLGRAKEKPSERNHSRSIDLDILWYKDTALKAPMLTIPHPRAFERDFVLIPLSEILPDNWQSPLDGRPLSSFLTSCQNLSNPQKLARW